MSLRSTFFALCMLWTAVLVGCGSDEPGSSGPPPITISGAGGSSSGVAGTLGTSGPSTTSPIATGPLAGRGASTAGAPSGITAGTGAAVPPAPAGTETLPCGVSKVLATNCQQCHGAAPIGGAPMPLVTYADLHKPAFTQPSMKVYQLSKLRINDKARPMPQGATMPPTDFSQLDTWLGAGALAGTAADKDCAVAPPPATSESGDGSYGALTPLPGETCYDFVTHQSTTSVDATPYSVQQGEHYAQFYFKAPWPKGSLATRYGTKLDNEKILHHWLLFQTAENFAEGFHKTAPLPTLIGVNATLLAGWAVGGSNLAMPEDVGLELPPPGTQLNVQWHYYNNTGAQQTDRSAIQVCVVPPGMRKNTASMTWVGNEDLGGNVWFGGAGMPAHKVSTYSGTCNPLRTGMNTTDPIHITAFWPHMHTLGTNMKSVINRKDGTKETVFDKPFDFNRQIHYNVDLQLMPGDTLTATCTFNNTTAKGVPFGESTDTEMCYQFVYSWPAHSLENHAASLLGATNTCW